MRRIADEIRCNIHGGHGPSCRAYRSWFDNPLKYAHIVTSTTHKTLRGPRGGLILLGKDFDNPWGKTTPKGVVKKMSQLLDSAVFLAYRAVRLGMLSRLSTASGNSTSATFIMPFAARRLLGRLLPMVTGVCILAIPNIF